MKKLFSILLIIGMLLFAGCSQKNGQNSASDSQKMQTSADQERLNKSSYDEEDLQKENMMGSNENYEMPTQESEKIAIKLSTLAQGEIDAKITYDGKLLTDATVTIIGVSKNTKIKDINWIKSAINMRSNNSSGGYTLYYDPSAEKIVIRVKAGNVYKQMEKNVEEISSHGKGV